MRTKRTNIGFEKLHPYKEVNAYLDQIDEHKKNNGRKQEKIAIQWTIQLVRSVNLICKINFPFIFPAHGINGLVIHTTLTAVTM